MTEPKYPVNFGSKSQLGGGKSLEGGKIYENKTKKSKCAWKIMAAVIAIVIIIVIIIVIVVVTVRSKKKAANVCDSKQCTQAAENLMSNMDASCEPCDNFHKFVCGKYDYNNKIPPWSSKQAKLVRMMDRVNEQVKAILEEKMKPGDFEGLTLAKKYYISCLSQEHQQWIPTALRIQKQLGVTPTMVGQWIPPSGYSKERQFVKLLNLGIHLIMQIYVFQNPKNTAQRIIHMATPDDAPKLLRNILLKGKNTNIAAKDQQDIRNLGDALMKVPFKKEENIWKTIKELKNEISYVDWDIIFSIFPRSMNISDDETVIVISWNQFKNTLNVLSRSPDRVIQNYVMGAYAIAVNGIGPAQKRLDAPILWRKCVELATHYFGNIISAEYIEKHMDKKQVKTIENMSQSIRNTLIELIQTADWFDEVTRSRALKKVNQMELEIAHPKHMFNKTFLMQGYKMVNIKEDDFFQNNFQLTTTNMQQMLNSLRDPIQRGMWVVPPVKVNAFYHRLNNQMVFPAAIMQFPAVLDDAPPYLSYGRLGTIVGHEMTHGFDFLGHKHNEIGDLEMWWTDATRKQFDKKMSCFVDQFSNTVDPISGQKLNGELTLAENMADTGGLKLAYTAFMKLLSKKPDMPTLPNMDSYTPEQLFFIVFGNLWCEIYAPQERQKYLEDTHSLGRYRINFSLKNLQEFADAFKCPENAKMRISNRCEMW